MTNRHIVITPETTVPTDARRETIVQNTATRTTIHVIGGSEKVHHNNVALAQEIATVPNDASFGARLRRLLERMGLKSS